MRGTVVHFFVPDSYGYISGDDGNRYEFSGKDWGLTEPPKQGVRVDFGIQGDRAIKIFADPTEILTECKHPKSRAIASLLSFFLGSFGLQFFYLDLWVWGILSILFCWTYIPGIIGGYLGVKWHRMSDKEFQRTMQNLGGTIEDLQKLLNAKL